MFNLMNLDPLEFEKFCMDFMDKKLNIKFKRFGPGKDDGIDLISLDKKIICQCKRYKDSSKLKTICKNEYKKIEMQNFEKYYLLTTAELGETITKDIFDIFSKYMNDYSYIIGKNDIDDFLSEESNVDVLKKNHKLWLSSSVVLDLYLNRYSDAISKVIINDFEKESKYFVETKAYYKAVDIINSNGIILFVGDPGIGKTITSKMLIRYLLASNKAYKLTTVSNNDLSKLIESVHQNDDPEIIFLDDFLGQTSLSLDDKLINELKNLLKLTTIFNNKKVILNSRITILNKAKHEKEEFEKLLDELGIKECLIDVNDISHLDRARILYNLMYHNNVTKKSYQSVKENRKYNSIINHKSFNTRIIEMCAKNANKRDDDFYDYLIESLNNPKGIWKSEFERIEVCDVILMYQLYTLGNNYVPIDVIHKSVTNFLCACNYEVEKYSFEDSINRLSKSLIGIAILGKKKYLSVLNPSINDYIQNYLLDNLAELKKIYENSIYIEQIEKIANIYPDLLSKSIHNFEGLLCYSQYNSHIDSENLNIKKKINFILKNNYCDINIKDYLLSFFETNLGGDYHIKLLLNKKIQSFYGLQSILNNISLVSKRCSKSDYYYIEDLLKYYSNTELSKDVIEINFNTIYKNSLENKLISYGEEYTSDIISNTSPNDKFKGNEIKNLEIDDNYISNLELQIEEKLYSKAEELIDDIKIMGYKMEDISIDYNSIIDSICVEAILDDDLNEFIKEIASESIDYDYSDMEINNGITVDDIFNQDYDVDD